MQDLADLRPPLQAQMGLLQGLLRRRHGRAGVRLLPRRRPRRVDCCVLVERSYVAVAAVAARARVWSPELHHPGRLPRWRRRDRDRVLRRGDAGGSGRQGGAGGEEAGVEVPGERADRGGRRRRRVLLGRVQLGRRRRAWGVRVPGGGGRGVGGDGGGGEEDDEEEQRVGGGGVAGRGVVGGELE